jgi:hypothetical protein
MGVETYAAIAAISALYGAKTQADSAYDQQKNADDVAYKQKQQIAAQNARNAEQDVLARNEMEAGLEDESGGPRLRSVAQGQGGRRVRRDTLTQKGLGIPTQGKQGLQTGYAGNV